MFGDMLEIPQLQSWDENWCYYQKWRAISQAPISKYMMCHRCNKHCPLRSGDVDITGTPCTDYSKGNAYRRLWEGPTVHIWLIWCTFHRRHHTPIMIHENVTGFPVMLALANMSDMYNVHVLYCSPKRVGYQMVARDRQFIVFIHRTKATVLRNLSATLDFVCGKLTSRAVTQPCHALVAPRGERDK